MTSELQEADWNRLLRRIQSGKCTPFLGAGACYGTLPLGVDVAEELAQRYAYLFPDRDLVRVAQYAAVQSDPDAPKEDVVDILRAAGPPKYTQPPEFGNSGEPHSVLAGLPLPIVITTNCDDFMVRALKWKLKDARREICRWNRHIPAMAPSFDPDFTYSVANPLVDHFHGCTPWGESALVTEDDYFEFLINISRDYKLLTHRVDRALGGALLFLGYTLSDWDFLVLFRLFANKLRDSGNTHIAVQLEPFRAPHDQAEKAAKAVKYLDSSFGSAQVKIYWGTCQEFCEELRVRWEAFNRG